MSRVKSKTYLRTDNMNKLLEKNEVYGCLFCSEKPSHIFRYWSLRKNDFPYDAIAKKHDMLFLKRHAKFPNMEEREELKTILRTIRQFGVYEAMLESLDEQASIPNHFHVHLIQFKRHKV